MKITVIIEDTGGAIHMGFAVGYRRVTLDLTPEQEAALRLRHEHESYGTTFIEKDEEKKCGHMKCPMGPNCKDHES